MRKSYVETLFNKLSNDMDLKMRHEVVTNIVDEVVKTDSSLLSIDKQLAGYGVWRSKPFVNEYHFGTKLAIQITLATHGRITHEAEKIFQIEDFRESLYNQLLEYNE